MSCSTACVRPRGGPRTAGGLAYRSSPLEETLAESGVRPVIERFRQRGKHQQVEIAFASHKRKFRFEEMLTTTLAGLATRIAAKITA